MKQDRRNSTAWLILFGALTFGHQNAYAVPVNESCAAAYAAFEYMLPNIDKQQKVVMIRAHISDFYPISEQDLIKEEVGDLTRREDIKIANGSIVRGWHIDPPGRALVLAFINSVQISALSCGRVRDLARSSQFAIGRRAELKLKANIERSDRVGRERKYQIIQLNLPILDKSKKEALAYVSYTQGPGPGVVWHYCSGR